MGKFIYVFNEKNKDELCSMGFRLLKGDSKPFIFANNQEIQANFGDMQIIKSDVMQF